MRPGLKDALKYANVRDPNEGFKLADKAALKAAGGGRRAMQSNDPVRLAIYNRQALVAGGARKGFVKQMPSP